MCALAALAPSAAAQQPVPAQPQVLDGPSADIVRPSGIGISIARDGTGGLVYLKQVAGVQHVFVSTLAGGSFQSPIQVDQGLGSSSQPVIAAGNGGLLLVAFVSGGQLYVAGRMAGTGALATRALAAGSMNPAISIANSGKAYLTFIAADGGGDDVRVAYYNRGRWAMAPGAVSNSALNEPGTGAGAPAVATSGDGVGIIAWGEAGHVFARRVWGTALSVATEQADAALPGCSEASADQPQVGTGGNSSFADIVFHETLSCAAGGLQQSRVLMNRLKGSQFLGLAQPDGLAGSGADNATDPQITMGEYGHGWITSARTGSNALMAAPLGDDGAAGGASQINSIPDAAPPDGVPATAGLFSNLIAWQQTPGSSGQGEIRVRYAPKNEGFGPETVVSSSAQGPTDADSGLAAAGDVAGDSAIAWVQGAPGATQIVVAQLYQGPAPFGLLGPSHYVQLSQPQLSWSPSREPWGPVTYSVSVDGAQIGQTQSTSMVVPTALTDGPHSWSVMAANPVGQTARSGTAAVFVDTVAPTAQLVFSGTKLIGRPVNVFLTYVDLPPAGEPITDASGVSAAVVAWGDGTVSPLHRGWHRSFHTYTSPGVYTISAAVTDRAGNVGRATLTVRIRKPKPKPKKHGTKPRHRTRA